MKYTLTFLLFVCLNWGYSQTRASVEFLGSNGLGISGNIEQVFSFSEKHKFGVRAGLGVMIQGDPEAKWLYKGGVNYYLNSWGIGSDVTVVNRTGSPSTNSYTELDLLFYPNINYTWNLKKNNFIKISAGVGIGRQRVINPEMNPHQDQNLSWSTAPWTGLIYGFNLKK